MRLPLLLLLIALLPASTRGQDTIPLTPGMVITTSVTITPGTYRLPADGSGAVRIMGDSVRVDFHGAVLEGADPGDAPDSFSGTGVVVENSAGVHIRGLTVRGYKVGLRAQSTPGLVLTDSDLSYNWRQRLKSTVEREHLDDWMSYHQNEKDEWLEYGAAAYLRDCAGCLIERIRVTGGQNGLLLMEVNDSVIMDNVITFNSSLGIGMYRSSRNRVVHNTLDFNVRGYSHGIYNRGQDSAAILIYEQSNDNEFAYNSATHSGDGFFLWAGQTTMDSGQGGCNGNLLFRNDFSFAPTNGIEITFSSNRVIDNYIEGCWHGIWGGYSFDTVIEGNTFVDNEEHIAIEHGQNLQVSRNSFIGGDVGLKLWERDTQPDDWGYAAARDVRSRDYDVAANEFVDVGVPVDANRTSGLRVQGNVFARGGPWRLDETPGLLLAANDFLEGAPRPRDHMGTLGSRVHLTSGQRVPHPRNRAYILVDEWGPHDFRSPVFWPRSPRQAAEQWFEIVGPEGTWEITATSGIDSLSAGQGMVGDSIRVWPARTGVVDMVLEGRYKGGEVTDRFGAVTPAGSPFAFSYRYFFAPIDWTVEFWPWTGETDPRTQPLAFQALLSGPPTYSETTRDLGYQWYGEPAPGLPPNQFATRSVGHVEVPEGLYVLDLTSDDGVRVWVDDALVHDDWTYHAPRQERIELRLGGKHTIRIEHFEIDGYATVVASLSRK